MFLHSVRPRGNSNYVTTMGIYRFFLTNSCKSNNERMRNCAGLGVLLNLTVASVLSAASYVVRPI